jgi:hypothetical protein
VDRSSVSTTPATRSLNLFYSYLQSLVVDHFRFVHVDSGTARQPSGRNQEFGWVDLLWSELWKLR